MDEEHGIRRVEMLASDLVWTAPEEALQMVQQLRQMLDQEGRADPRPIPRKHRLRILGEIVRVMLPDGEAELRARNVVLLETRQRQYLAMFLAEASMALRRRLDTGQTSRLGFPPDTRARWANLIDQGWLEYRPGWLGRLRD